MGVIATAGTIQSQIYTEYIQGIEQDIQVIGKACPLFVPLVEEGLLEDPVTDEIATRYLNELKDIGIDTLIFKIKSAGSSIIVEGSDSLCQFFIIGCHGTRIAQCSQVLAWVETMGAGIS